MNNNPLTISITTGTIVRIVAILVACYLSFYFRNLLLLFLTAVVIASAIEPVVRRLENYKFPRALATASTYLAIFTVLIGGIALIVPVFITETQNLAQNIPEYLTSVEAIINGLLSSTGFQAEFESNITNVENIGAVSNELRGIADVFFSGARGALIFIFGSAFNFFLVFVIAFYLTLQKYGIDNFLKLVIPGSKIQYALNLWHRSQRRIGLWMGGQLVDGAIVGLMSFVGLSILGVEYAFLLALIAFFGSLIPLIGPLISVIPAMLLALSSGGLQLALYVAILYFVIQQVESNIIYPIVVKNVVGVPSLVVIMAVVVGGSLFGFLGIVLSVPVAAAAMEYIRDIQKRNLETEKRVEEAAKTLAEEESADKSEEEKTETV